MKLVAVEDTTLTVPDLAQLAGKGPIILTKKGKPLAAVRAINGNDWESIALANNPRFQALIEKSRRSYREKGGISAQQVREELGLLKKPRRVSRSSHKRRAGGAGR